MHMVKFPIEWGKVREYATATGAGRPAYLDNPASVIPPTFLATVVYWKAIGNTVRSAEVAEACATAGVPFDITSLLSLEQEYVFHGPPPRAGDTLLTSERLHDVRIKHGRNGPMVIVRFVVSFCGDDDKVRAECWYTSAYVQKGES